MNWNNSKTVRKVLLGVCILINLSILIFAFVNIKYTSEFAGALINLGHRVKITIIGIALSLFFHLIVRLIFRHLKVSRYFTSIVLLIFISVFYYYTCISIIRPFEYDKIEIAQNQAKELSEMIKKGDKSLSKSKNLLNHQKIKLEDSTAIIHYFSNFLDSAFYHYSDSIKIDYSSKFHNFFNRNLINRPYGRVEMIFDSVGTNRYRQIIKNKLSIDLFLYSPKREKMFIVMTYEVGKDPTEANALALIGERYDNKILLYRYKYFRNDYGVVNKTYALYQIITNFEDRDNSNKRDKVNPLDNSFWDGWWYEQVDINNTKKYRYQLDDYAYKWNEKEQLNERITEEIKTFIEIDK